MPKDFLQGASLTPTFIQHFTVIILLPFLMLKIAFKKHPPQNRTNVQIKGGEGGRGVKGLLNNVQKNCTFLGGWLPLLLLLLLSSLLLYIDFVIVVMSHFFVVCVIQIVIVYFVLMSAGKEGTGEFNRV